VIDKIRQLEIITNARQMNDIRSSMNTREYLKHLGDKSNSDELDEIIMYNLLMNCSFKNAVITCGIVYLEGHGTMEAPPMDIQSCASMILKVVNA